MSMSNKTYDVLKALATYIIPGLGTLYFALAGIWCWPYGQEIVGSLTAIDAFLGVLLTISSSNYTVAVEATESEE